MISSSRSFRDDEIVERTYDVLLYGLGFETRSTFIASRANAKRIIALKLPRIGIHSYDRNVAFAQTSKHLIAADVTELIDRLSQTFGRSKKPLTVGIDITSMNRDALFSIVPTLAKLVRPEDVLEVLYCPALFAEPVWDFPQIEQLGPVSGLFSAFNADPARPLCLMLGLGFEPGVSMGVISHLEPRISYCFWGSGVDPRFDEAVSRANFELTFPGFDTKAVRYSLPDPKGAFEQIEALTYGLLRSYNLIFIPIGPKLFSLYAALLGLLYVGDVAIWKAKQNRHNSPDAEPSSIIISAVLDTGLLMNRAQVGSEILGQEHLS